MRKLQRSGFVVATVSVLILVSTGVLADDETDLQALLNTFLSGVTEAETHDRFWADDLIYTSSRGTRSTKADIMAGFDSAATANSAAGPDYSAEDVQIQVYGDTAVVAFRLVAVPPGSTERQEYLNTGTFLKRDDVWKVIAWQATIVPGSIIPAE